MKLDIFTEDLIDNMIALAIVVPLFWIFFVIPVEKKYNL